MKPSLVVLGNSVQGLGIIRSAELLNIPVFILHDVHFCSTRFSKYTNNYIKLPKYSIRDLAVSSSNEFLVKKLLSLPVSYPSPLFGINEDIINFFSVNRKTLSQKYFIPENKLDHIFDKYEFNKLSPEENRIETYLLSEVTLDHFVHDNFLIKSRRGNKLRNYTNKKAISINILSSIQKETIKKYFQQDELIVQRIIKSTKPVKSFCVFSVDGVIFGLFQYEKVRQHPDQFGTGTYLKSVYEPELETLSKEILTKLKYTGISEIEFIYDDDEKNYKALEMNPRTWKSINFAAKCGQNLVEKYIKHILNHPYDKSLDYDVDKYWVDIFTDLPQMFREKRIFNYSKDETFEGTWDRKDPLPFFANIIFAPFILMKI